jgi:hypothetical protein
MFFGTFIFSEEFLNMANNTQIRIILFTIVNALHVSRPNSSTLAVTANKFDKYLMLHVQIWAPDDERKNR